MATEYLSEDVIRDKAKNILGFEDSEAAISGVGQLTSWKSLGFKNVQGAPDGWYLPKVDTFPAIVAEFKSNSTKLRQSQIDETVKNCNILLTKYTKVIGILWNGVDIMVFKNGILIEASNTLQPKEYYFGLFEKNGIDKQRIFNLTKRINDSLHFQFGIKNLYHRMIFTACALVAKRYGAVLVKGMSYNSFIQSIRDTLSKSYESAIKQNQKLDILLETYAGIKMNISNSQEAIDDFIESVTSLSDNINSDFWNGEDVMAIFFNEFNRYKAKSESGQVFTPDHITSLIYRVTGVTATDKILDAACGSGAFLVKSMCNMIKEVGGIRTSQASEIKSKQLFGIELDKEIFALACANMLIHKDGKTNLEQMDSSTAEASQWIESKGITKVLMNPPFETKYKCLDIVLNVLNSVPKDTICAFILPDNKLDKNIGKARKILSSHTLEKIIKLPEMIFSGVVTSVFIFRAKVSHLTKPIFSCYIENDGLVTIKNQGRQDIRGSWAAIEDYWVDIIYRQSGDSTIQWINPNERLSYKLPPKPFNITTADFNQSLLKYVLYLRGIDEVDFREQIIPCLLHGAPIPPEYDFLIDSLPMENVTIDFSKWKDFPIKKFFDISKGKRLTKTDMVDGNINYVGASAFNNGITAKIGNDNEINDSNTITVCYNGSVGQAFFQTEPYWATDDVNILTPKFALNKYIALFFTSIIRHVGQNYAFVDKWVIETMRSSIIKLPVNEKGDADFDYMENFIKSLPYGKYI